MRAVQRTALAAVIALAAGPAFAAKGPFFSLGNSDFVVLIAFVIFIGVLLYFKVPGMIGTMLDERADKVRQELETARNLREEAQTILAEFERKQKDVQEESQRIVAQAKADAESAAAQAKEDLQTSIERRMKAAADQIASAEEAAVKEVRDRAVQVAVAAAADVVRAGITPADADALIGESLKVVEQKLH